MLNIAICGAGRAGTFLHFNVYKELNCNVVAIVDPNEALVNEKTKELNIKRSFNNIDALIASKENIDVVSVCTNLASHYDVAKKSLLAGFNVLVEKPATEKDEQLDELYELAEKLNLKLAVVHNHKYYPSFVKLRNLINSKALGDIIHIDRVMSFDRNSVRMMEPEHWSHNLPGGRLFEANPHNLYLLYGFVGNIELVKIEPTNKPNYFPHATISGFNTMFRGESCSVNLTMSLNCDVQKFGYHAPSYFLITFEKGAVYCDNGELIMLKASLKNKMSHLFSELLNSLKEKLTTAKPIGKGSGHYWFLKEFLDSVVNKESESPVPYSEAKFAQVMNNKMGKEIESILKD